MTLTSFKRPWTYIQITKALWWISVSG